MMIQKKSSRAFVGCWLIASVAGLFYYGWVWPTAPIEGPDTSSYLEMARDLRDGTLDQLYMRTPGFPLFLLLTGAADGTSRSILYIHVLLHFISVFLVVDLMRRLEMSPWLSYAIFVMGFLPFSVQIALYVMTEPVTEFMIVLGMTGLMRWLRWGRVGWLAASGFALSYAAITRPTYQLIGPLVAVALIGSVILYRPLRAKSRRVVTAAIVIMGGTAIFLGGLVANNYFRFGFLGAVPAGVHLCNKTCRVLERLPDEHAQVRDILIKYRDQQMLSDHWSGINYIWKALPELKSATGLSEPELTKYLQKLNLILIAKSPITYMHEVASTMGENCMPIIDTVSYFGRRSVQAAWAVIQIVLFGIFIYVTVRITGAMLLWRKIPRPVQTFRISPGLGSGPIKVVMIVILAGLVAYSFIISAMFDATVERYRQPVELMMWFLAALEIDLWRRMSRALREMRAAATT